MPGMADEDDLRRVEEHIADARRLVHRQKGLITRARGWRRDVGCPKSTVAPGIQPETLEEHRDRLKHAPLDDALTPVERYG
jgi:hypothetical protein